MVSASAKNVTSPTSSGGIASNNTRVIESELIDRFLITILVQKLSWVKVENMSILEISTLTQDIFELE